ncbi:MAG: hypothetical protein M0T74_06845 [Desulfitobacterium hafniense]|nr:hypothetical protein [Desulfitobacterium hafniense]
MAEYDSLLELQNVVSAHYVYYFELDPTVQLHVRLIIGSSVPLGVWKLGSFLEAH